MQAAYTFPSGNHDLPSKCGVCGVCGVGGEYFKDRDGHAAWKGEDLRQREGLS